MGNKTLAWKSNEKWILRFNCKRYYEKNLTITIGWVATIDKTSILKEKGNLAASGVSQKLFKKKYLMAETKEKQEKNFR